MPLYDEIEIEDMTYDPETRVYSYPCPCGDRFKVALEDLWDGEDIADCQSCTLYIEVIYEEDDLPPLPEDDSESDVDNSENSNLALEQDDGSIDKDDNTNGKGGIEDNVNRDMGKLSVSSQSPKQVISWFYGNLFRQSKLQILFAWQEKERWARNVFKYGIILPISTTLCYGRKNGGISSAS